jgi:hypothetical protein
MIPELTTQEKLDMYKAAYAYHSTKPAEDLSQDEEAWLKWVPGRIKELEETWD